MGYCCCHQEVRSGGPRLSHRFIITRCNGVRRIAPPEIASHHTGVQAGSTTPCHQRNVTANEEICTERHSGHDKPSLVADFGSGNLRSFLKILPGPDSEDSIVESLNTARTLRMKTNQRLCSVVIFYSEYSSSQPPHASTSSKLYSAASMSPHRSQCLDMNNKTLCSRCV